MVDESERRERIAELQKRRDALRAVYIGKRTDMELRAMDAEIARLSESGAVPESGWKLVPIEPTYQMLGEGVMHVEGPEDIAPTEALLNAWAAMLAAAPVSPAPQANGVRETLIDVTASLVAAVSLLKRGGNAAKKAAPSNKMFDQMVKDYEASIDRARVALSQSSIAPSETSVCDHLLPQAGQGCGTLVRETPHPATTIMRLMAYHFGVTDHPETFQDSEAVAIVVVALSQSSIAPGILHNEEAGFREVVLRDTASIYDNNTQLRLVEEIFDADRKLLGFRVYDKIINTTAPGLVAAAELAEAKAMKLHHPNSSAELFEFADELRSLSASDRREEGKSDAN